MIHTENEMLEKAVKVFKDLDPEFFKLESIQRVRYENDSKIFFGKFKDTIKSCWIVSVKEPVFEGLTFLTLSDEDGEPLFIQSSQSVMEIEKRGSKYLANK